VTALGKRSNARRNTVKARLYGGLLLVGLAGVLATAALAAGNGHAKKSAGIKIGISLAGYSTDFWSSYVAFEKAAGTKYGFSLVGPISFERRRG
jgi:ABC-type sugar transport system substrate-binding protein